MAVSNSKCEKLLGIHIDNKLTFEPYVRSLCKKINQKLNTFARIACSLKFDQRKLLNAFITSQFSYAPDVSMFRNRKINNNINQIHERVYQDHNSTFEELLAKGGSFKIHYRNLQRLLIEIFKVKMKLAPEIMNGVFDIIESPYPLGNELRFKSKNIRTVRYGIETAAFVSSRIWSYMPSELKEIMLLNKFRSKIKTWKPENCPCKLCKIYLQRIGYLQVTN